MRNSRPNFRLYSYITVKCGTFGWVRDFAIFVTYPGYDYRWRLDVSLSNVFGSTRCGALRPQPLEQPDRRNRNDRPVQRETDDNRRQQRPPRHPKRLEGYRRCVNPRPWRNNDHAPNTPTLYDSRQPPAAAPQYPRGGQTQNGWAQRQYNPHHPGSTFGPPEQPRDHQRRQAIEYHRDHCHQHGIQPQSHSQRYGNQFLADGRHGNQSHSDQFRKQRTQTRMSMSIRPDIRIGSTGRYLPSCPIAALGYNRGPRLPTLPSNISTLGKYI